MLTQNNNYLQAHKRWTVKITGLKDKAQKNNIDFSFDFLDALVKQVDKDKQLTAKQFNAMKKCVWVLEQKLSALEQG